MSIGDEIIINIFGFYQSKRAELDARICHKNLTRRLDYLTPNSLEIIQFTDFSTGITYEVKDNDIFRKYKVVQDGPLGDQDTTLCLCGQPIKYIFVLQNKDKTIKLQIGSKCILRFNKDLGKEAARLIAKTKKKSDEKCYICKQGGISTRGGLIKHLFSNTHLERMKSHITNQIRKKKLEEEESSETRPCIDCRKRIKIIRFRPRCMDCWKNKNNIKEKLLIN